MSTTPTISEQAIKQLAESKIQAACDRTGADRASLKDAVISDAYEWAKETLTAQAEKAANPYAQENEKLREELRVARMEAQALRDSRQNVSVAAQQPNTQLSVDVARARAGEMNWNIKFTDNERMAAIGISPDFNTAQNRAEAKELFASGADSARATDLFKRDAQRYRKLREFARAVRII